MEKADSKGNKLIHLQPGTTDINAKAPLEFLWQQCGAQLVRQTSSLLHSTDSKLHKKEKQHLAKVGRLMKAQREIFPEVTDVPERK